MNKNIIGGLVAIAVLAAIFIIHAWQHTAHVQAVTPVAVAAPVAPVVHSKPVFHQKLKARARVKTN